jgi:hypothetical protein
MFYENMIGFLKEAGKIDSAVEFGESFSARSEFSGQDAYG